MSLSPASPSGTPSGSGSGFVSSIPVPAGCGDSLLVERVRVAMDTYTYNQMDVMRDSGVSNSVLCLWLQHKYKVTHQ